MNSIKVGQKFDNNGRVLEVVMLARESHTYDDVVVFKYDGCYWVRRKMDFLSEVIGNKNEEQYYDESC